MAKKKQTFLDQLEAAMMKFGPIIPAFIAAVVGSSLIKGHAPAIVGFALGGAIGGVLGLLAVKGIFLVINPTRKS